MLVIDTVRKLSNELDNFRQKRLSIGFVPTMGALHNGHISLINKAADENDIVLISIFVNPTQFNNPVDLKNYPRDTASDIKILETTKCNLLFVPSENEVYPNDKSKIANFNFGHLTEVMEGKYRPGHFDGVAVVIKRLFEIVKPNKAYFGQKDIQQFLVINELNKNYLSELKIELVKCPIIREPDGLAMSSRNVLLSSEQRASATLISKSLFKAKEYYKNYLPSELKKIIIDRIHSDSNLKVEYLEFVTDPGLNFLDRWIDGEKILACIAVQVGQVRLIDNIYFN